MIIDNIIISFSDNERWLSNFVDCYIEFEGRTFRSVEHAYQSAKSNDESWKQICSDFTNTSGKIKRLSRDIQIVCNWDTIKKDIMWTLLNQKYHQEPFKELLLNTNDMIIREGNTWGDYFWGTNLEGTIGSNNLGKMLMRIRENLKTPPLF